MEHVCTNCGARHVQDARFCAWCGAPVDRQLADPFLEPRPSTDPTADVLADAPTAPLGVSAAVDPYRPKRRLQSHRSLLATVTCAVLVVAVVGLAFTAGGTFGSGAKTHSSAGPMTAATAGSTVARRPVAPARRSSTGDQRERTFVVALDLILEQAATGHSQLVGALDGVQLRCPATALAASAAIQGVVTNRATALQELAGLPPAPNPQELALQVLLAEALQASAQADARYEVWASSLGSTGSAGCVANAGGSDAAYAQARAADSTATAYKSEFVTAFNPLEARFNLPAWAQSEF